MNYFAKRTIESALKGRIAWKSLERARSDDYRKYRHSALGRDKAKIQDRAALVVLENETQAIAPLENAARARMKEIADLKLMLAAVDPRRVWWKVSEFLNA